jgi:hypothetical protein
MIKDFIIVLGQAIKKMTGREVMWWLIIASILAFTTYNFADIKEIVFHSQELKYNVQVQKMISDTVRAVNKEHWHRIGSLRHTVDSLENKIREYEISH